MTPTKSPPSASRSQKRSGAPRAPTKSGTSQRAPAPRRPQGTKPAAGRDRQPRALPWRRSEGRVARIEPHLEARRRDQQRSRGRRSWRRLLWVAVAAVVFAAALIVAHSPLLSARVLTVTGTATLTSSQRAQVVAASGLASRPPLLDVNPAAVSARVQRLPWVKGAAVVRHWPDGVSVQVGVRKPVAVVPGSSGGLVEVDRTGRVLAKVPSAPAGMVTLRAPVEPGAPGTWLAKGALPGLRVAATLPPALGGLVAAVVVQPQDQVDLQLTAPLTVHLGTATDLRQKYEDAASVLASASFSAGEVLDVSIPQSPSVAPPAQG